MNPRAIMYSAAALALATGIVIYLLREPDSTPTQTNIPELTAPPEKSKHAETVRTADWTSDEALATLKDAINKKADMTTISRLFSRLAMVDERAALQFAITQQGDTYNVLMGDLIWSYGDKILGPLIAHLEGLPNDTVKLDFLKRLTRFAPAHGDMLWKLIDQWPPGAQRHILVEEFARKCAPHFYNNLENILAGATSQDRTIWLRNFQSQADKLSLPDLQKLAQTTKDKGIQSVVTRNLALHQAKSASSTAQVDTTGIPSDQLPAFWKAAIESLAGKNLDAIAVELGKSLPPGADMGAYRSLMVQFAYQSPAGGAAWLESLSDIKIRTELTGNFVNMWLTADSKAASAWAASFEGPAEVRSAAAKAVVSYLMDKNDLVSAREWAARIGNPAERATAMADIEFKQKNSSGNP